MPYEPLHHKYRPQTFADLVGQEAIATTLINAIRQQRIAPAYLFSGPRGTGKTSSARILAKSLNCLSSDVPTENPCGKCDVCRGIVKGSTLDVIEIDAASNTGVDNIRELIDRAQFAPAQCRYKVYIIDEVHMLSSAAFNALLKTLEEPPNRVTFILATTDPQRVLPTIISRCQRFDFRRIPLESMVQHLRDISNRENINITDDALTLVAQMAQGGLRDAESTLDQLSLSSEQVTVEKVWDLVGAVPERDLMSLIEAIANNEAIAVLDIARRLMDRGREPLIVIQNLASFYRDLLIAQTAPMRSDLVATTPPTWQALCNFKELNISEILAGQKILKDSEIQIKNTTQPRLWLEVTLLGLLPAAMAQETVKQSVMTARTLPIQPVENNRDRQQQVYVRTTQIRPENPSSNPNYSPSPARSEPVETTQQNSPPVSINPPAKQENIEVIEKEEYADNSITSHVETEVEPNFSASEAEDILNEEPDFNKIWQKVIPHIQPNSLQQLMSQLCHLETFDGKIARISVRTASSSEKSWIDKLQQKIPNIEAAFQQALNLQVRVIPIPATSTNSKNGRSYKQKTSTDSSNIPKPTGNSKNTLAAPPSSAIAPSPPIVQSETQERVAPSYPTQINASTTAAPSPVVKEAGKIDKQEIQEIVIPERTENIPLSTQLLADFFQGKIIPLTDELEQSLFATKKQQPESIETDVVEPEYLENPIDDESEDF